MYNLDKKKSSENSQYTKHTKFMFEKLRNKIRIERANKTDRFFSDILEGVKNELKHDLEREKKIRVYIKNFNLQNSYYKHSHKMDLETYNIYKLRNFLRMRNFLSQKLKIEHNFSFYHIFMFFREHFWLKNFMLFKFFSFFSMIFFSTSIFLIQNFYFPNNVGITITFTDIITKIPPFC